MVVHQCEYTYRRRIEPLKNGQVVDFMMHVLSQPYSTDISDERKGREFITRRLALLVGMQILGKEGKYWKC